MCGGASSPLYCHVAIEREHIRAGKMLPNSFDQLGGMMHGCSLRRSAQQCGKHQVTQPYRAATTCGVISNEILRYCKALKTPESHKTSPQNFREPMQDGGWVAMDQEARRTAASGRLTGVREGSACHAPAELGLLRWRSLPSLGSWGLVGTSGSSS